MYLLFAALHHSSFAALFATLLPAQQSAAPSTDKALHLPALLLLLAAVGPGCCCCCCWLLCVG
jgi:hypothetical protein